MRLKDKIILVTGAGKGIGRGIAIKLLKEGATVVFNDIKQEHLDKIGNEIENLKGEWAGMLADVTKYSEVDAMVKSILQKHERIDAVVNNAGGSARAKATLFQDSTEEIWDYVIKLNLKSTFIVTRAIINHMIQRGKGKIVNISSGAGIVGMAKIADYSATKAGINGFTKALAREVGCHGICVNSVAPGFIVTEDVLATHSEDFLKKGRESILLPKEGTPEDIGNIVAFLCSEEADYITGEVILVGGGGFMG
jgi:3-oxoacyl-[acyl-carrier protein] reductase